jgi:uncharacterized protein YjiS (DUF1127 family)
MSTTELTRTAPTGSITVFRVVSFVERVVDAVATWRRSRATEEALADLSDKQLADIGLHRGDIAEVAGTLARR